MGNSQSHIRNGLSKWTFIALLALFAFPVLSQFDFVNTHRFTPKIDTLLFEHRSGTNHIDSMDLAYYGGYPSIFNNGRGILPYFQSLNNYGSYRYFFTDERPVYRAGYQFTALPYAGFYYSFGGGGEQVLDLRYSQNVGQNFNLSFRFHRAVSDRPTSGFLMRRSEIVSNDVSLNLHYHKGKWNSFLETYFGFDNYHENFGLNSAGLLNEALFLVQIPENRSFASVRTRRAQVALRTEYALVEDSIKTLKYVFQPSFHTFQRRFRDSLLNDTYSFWLLDSMKTRDSWEEPHALLENGFLFKTKDLELYGGFVFDYFQYYNFGRRAERLDGYITGALKLQVNQLNLAAKVRYFLFGTPGEFQNFAQLNYKLTEKISANGDFIFDRTFPEFFQLYYSANAVNYDYSNENISPTTRFKLEGQISYGEKRKVSAGVAYMNVSNLYYLQNLTWNFDGQQQFIAPHIAWDLQWKKLVWQGRARYFSGQKDLLSTPDYHLQTRLFLDGALFKAQRLKVATGVDFHYFDGYQVFAYQPELGVFAQSTSSALLPQTNMMLNAFVNLQMDRFRFFVSVNRINELFQSRSAMVEGIPFRPFFIRMGLSWDFVN
jgi:hypothetical protein